MGRKNLQIRKHPGWLGWEEEWKGMSRGGVCLQDRILGGYCSGESGKSWDGGVGEVTGLDQTKSRSVDQPIFDFIWYLKCYIAGLSDRAIA